VGVGTGEPPPAFPEVCVGTAFGAPGDTVRIPLLLTNPDGPDIGGLEASILLQSTDQATFLGLEDTTDFPAFDILAFEPEAGLTRIAFYSLDNQVIPPDAEPVRLATLVYVIHPEAPLGSTNALTIDELIVSDEFGDAVEAEFCPGAIQVGIPGDVDLDGRVTILDVVRLARILIGRDPAPEEGTTLFKIADANGDGILNVADITQQVNIILRIPVPAGKLVVLEPAIVRLGEAVAVAEGLAVPVYLDTSMPLAGLQAQVVFDAGMLAVGEPYLPEGARGVEVMGHVSDGTLRLVVFRTALDGQVTGGMQPVVWIPMRVQQGAMGSARVSLVEAVGATAWAQTAEVRVVGGEVTVPAVKAGVPGSFALHGSRPNPFNPSTRIAYEVPAAAHIRLVVYNLLGQEIARLVDEVKAPGRYQVVWDGRNAQGLGVASGVYLYRLTSGTGFAETKRMTLLK
jgi:hypothetical protein